MGAGRLLLVFAHPDDESFFCAGTVARHAAGGEAALVSATQGDRGSQPNPPVCKPEELGRVRSAELRHPTDDPAGLRAGGAGDQEGRRPIPDGGHEAAIDIAAVPAKIASLLAHRSQRHNVERTFGPIWDFVTGKPKDEEAAAIVGREYYTLACGPRPAYLLEDVLTDTWGPA